MKEQFLTAEELAEYLRVPQSTIYYLAQTKRIPAFRVGKHWRFVKEEIDKWRKKQAKVK
jgi:excisionase family DNA binding protein